MATTVRWSGANTVGAGVIGLAAVALVVASTSWWAVVPTTLLLVIAWVTGSAAPWPDDGTQRSSFLAALCWGAVGLASVMSFGLVWPIPQLLGLAAVGVVLWQRGWESPTWLGRGRDDWTARLLAFVSIPVTTLSLVAFIASGRTDLDVATDGLGSVPTWTLPLVGLGFVLANPTVEEVLFRGLLQTVFHHVTDKPAVAILAQGVAFGAIHLNGVPGGSLGMTMAAGWGVVLGVVRYRTGSIRLVWTVHVLANVAIYSTVIVLALDQGVL